MSEIKKQLDYILQVDRAYRDIALRLEVPDLEKIDRLRKAYRQAWFESCDDAESKWRKRQLEAY